MRLPSRQVSRYEPDDKRGELGILQVLTDKDGVYPEFCEQSNVATELVGTVVSEDMLVCVSTELVYHAVHLKLRSWLSEQLKCNWQ